MKVRKDRVLIKRVEQKSEGGILIPDSAKTPSNMGEVINIGTDVTELEIGQTVIFGQSHGIQIEVDGVELLIMSEGNVLAIVE